ncbi:MAG: hypothetical protein FJ379_15610 [Verrucomicrobia bacterium]|nr:hypothetical protein [Verrucomicrobiota bacterium]
MNPKRERSGLFHRGSGRPSEDSSGGHMTRVRSLPLLDGKPVLVSRPMESIVFLLVAGAVLLAVEPILPHLVSGSVGLVFWAIAVVLIYGRYGSSVGHLSLAVLLSVALVGSWWYLRKLPETRFGRSVRSDRVIPAETAAKTHLVGVDGVALTPLRPGGLAQFGVERVDVVTSGEPLDKGERIRVLSVDGPRVLVRSA